MLETFTLPYVQEGLVEILLLSIPAGLIGTWIVLRGLAFYSHAIGTASFPGLVLADGLGFSPALGAFGMAGIFTALSALLARSKRTAADSATALVLVTCLAAGVILASDVFASGANIDTLLFGSLLAIGPSDLILAGAAAVLAILMTLLCSHHWLAKGFDEDSAASLYSKSAWYDLALLTVVAVTVTAALSAVGALLVAAIMSVPAATVRMLTRRVKTLQIGSVLLVAVEGTLGLWLSVETNAPPGATIAVVSGTVFALVVLARIFWRRRSAGLAAVAVAGAVAVSGCAGGSSDQPVDGLRVVATTTQVNDIVRPKSAAIRSSWTGSSSRIRTPTTTSPGLPTCRPSPKPMSSSAAAETSTTGQSSWSKTAEATRRSSISARPCRFAWKAGTTTPMTSTTTPRKPDETPGDGHSEEGHNHSKEGDGNDKGDEGEHAHVGEDPHWWHDPRNVAVAIGEVQTALSQAEPGDSKQFAANARAFRQEVGRVDRRIEQCINSIPAEERKIVTDHDALEYFADRYDIEIVGTVIPALTSEAQPSAGDLAELEAVIEREDVKAVFPESAYSPNLAEAVAADTGASTEYSLYGDTLGPDGSGAETWAGMMMSNADSVVRGLTGGERGCEIR